VQAAQPLITQLRKRHPGYRILLTTVTPTGAARARLLFEDQVLLRYVPSTCRAQSRDSSTARSRSSR
jgi:3-deoxy-D-manno-octulosonic-acid transferase